MIEPPDILLITDKPELLCSGLLDIQAQWIEWVIFIFNAIYTLGNMAPGMTIKNYD